jgi:hypothetical protein
MIKNRIIYALWLLLSVMLFVLVNNISTVILLVVSIILPLVFIVFAKVNSTKICAEISLPDTCKKNEKINAVVTVYSKNRFLVSNVNCVVKCKNLLNSKTQTKNIIAQINSRLKTSTQFSFLSKYCGKISVSLDESVVCDLFNLVSFKVKNTNLGSSTIEVIPDIFNSEIIVADEIYSNFDSDIYSMDKSGNDFSETFMIREYAPGDAIKNIHFKLSQKVDKLMVRELGLPVVNDVLVLFDMSYISKENKPSAKYIDVITEVFASVLTNVAQSEINCTVAFKNNNTNSLEMYNLNSTEQVEYIFDKVLSNTFKFGESISSFFASNAQRINYQHIVLITLNNDTDVLNLYNYNRINELLLSNGNDLPILNGVYTTVFSKQNYKQALCALEI